MKTVKIQMYDQNDLKTLKGMSSEDRFIDVCEHRLALKDTADQDKKLKAFFDEDVAKLFAMDEHKDDSLIAFPGFKVMKSVKLNLDLKDESYSHRKSEDITKVYDKVIAMDKDIAKLESQLSVLKKTRNATVEAKLLPLLEDANKHGHKYAIGTKNTYSLRRA